MAEKLAKPAEYYGSPKGMPVGSKLTPEELGKWMNIANQNALEREAWAERYDRLHVALCQACELLNRGDSVTAHNIIRERLDAEYVEAKENAPHPHI